MGVRVYKTVVRKSWPWQWTLLALGNEEPSIKYLGYLVRFRNEATKTSQCRGSGEVPQCWSYNYVTFICKHCLFPSGQPIVYLDEDCPPTGYMGRVIKSEDLLHHPVFSVKNFPKGRSTSVRMSRHNEPSQLCSFWRRAVYSWYVRRSKIYLPELERNDRSLFYVFYFSI